MTGQADTEKIKIQIGKAYSKDEILKQLYYLAIRDPELEEFCDSRIRQINADADVIEYIWFIGEDGKARPLPSLVYGLKMDEFSNQAND